MNELSFTSFWEKLVEEAETEIEAVCIGHYHGKNPFGFNIPDEKRNKLISGIEASFLLSYPYDPSFGGPRCHAVTVWSKTRVVFIVQYDGSFRIESVARSPQEKSAFVFGE